jgi:hypothetical protein
VEETTARNVRGRMRRPTRRCFRSDIQNAIGSHFLRESTIEARLQVQNQLAVQLRVSESNLEMQEAGLKWLA